MRVPFLGGLYLFSLVVRSMKLFVTPDYNCFPNESKFNQKLYTSHSDGNVMVCT